MNADNIQDKLTLLPKGLAEENVLSWEYVARYCKTVFSLSSHFPWQALLEIIQELSTTEQAKLFRAGLSLYTLMISTKEKHGLDLEDAYIYVLMKAENLVEVGYYEANSQTAEKFDANNDELFSKIQPLLDRLWNETRGKNSV